MRSRLESPARSQNSSAESPMVSLQVLAYIASHLQHVEARHGEHRLQRTVGLDDPPLVELVHRTEMCHGDDARDVNPVEINLVEEELRHTAGCDARNPSPFGGRGNEGSMIKSDSAP